jgi:hypothetical protein
MLTRSDSMGYAGIELPRLASNTVAKRWIGQEVLYEAVTGAGISELVPGSGFICARMGE